MHIQIAVITSCRGRETSKSMKKAFSRWVCSDLLLKNGVGKEIDFLSWKKYFHCGIKKMLDLCCRVRLRAFPNSDGELPAWQKAASQSVDTHLGWSREERHLDPCSRHPCQLSKHLPLPRFSESSPRIWNVFKWNLSKTWYISLFFFWEIHIFWVLWVFSRQAEDNEISLSSHREETHFEERFITASVKSISIYSTVFTVLSYPGSC